MKKEELQRENEELRQQLAEAEDTLAAIREGKVDAIVMDGAAGLQVFSLAGAETVYRLAFETMAEAAINVTTEGIILFCNARFSEFVATPMEQLLGHDIAEFIQPEDREAFRALLLKCCDQLIGQRITLCGPGDMRRPVRLTGTALRQGDDLSLCLVATDLTSLEASTHQIELLRQAQSELRKSRLDALTLMEDALNARREAEQTASALRESEARFSSAFRFSPVGINIFRFSDGCSLDVNDAFLSIIEYSRDELLGHSADELGLFVDPGQRANWMKDLNEHGAVRNLDVQIRGKSGRIASVLFSLVKIELAGESMGLVMAIDITAEKKTEEALKESEKRYRELVQYAPAGIYEIDFRTRKFTSVNDAMCQMSGYTREELLGMDPLAILDQDSQKLFMQRLQMWLEGNPPQENVEYDVIRKDGSKIDVLLNVSFTRDVLGTPHGASVIGYDITDRKKAERNLELINRTLKALSNSNQAMVRAESETDLLNNVCRIIVEDCGYAMVWIGYAENDEAKSIRPVASAGFEAGYLETLKITWDDTERGRGPTGTAIRIGKTSRCRNMLTDPQFAPWREQALKRGYQSSMVVPILQNNKSIGAITIYARDPDVFYEDEEKLLIQLAGDLAHGIQMIRLREALRIAYVELEQKVAELQTLMDVAPVAIGVGHDPEGKVITVNRLLSEWLSVPIDANISFSVPKDQRQVDYEVFRNGQPVPVENLPFQYAALNGRGIRNDEFTLVRSDGRVIEMLANAQPLFDANGCVRGSIAAYIDITERKRAENELRAAHDELEQRVQERTAELERRNMELQVLGNAEREQRQLAEALVKAALVLGRSLNQDEVLQHILEQIQGVIPYQFATITLLDDESFYDASFQGTLISSEDEYTIKHRFPLKDFPILRKMRQTGRPVFLIDTAQDPDWVVIDSLAWSRSFLSAPLLVEKQVIGFVNLFSAQPLFFTQAMCDRLVAFASHAAVAIQNAWLFERVRAGSERLQSLSRRLVEIQENERHYIARELHDEAGQILTTLMVDLRLLEKEAAGSQSILAKITEMEASLNDVFDSLHRIAMALRPATLDHLGLVAALRQYVELMNEKQGLKINFHSEKVFERLHANVETVLYRIVQEALTNVIRHAHASQVDVVLTMRNDKLILIIEDDGIGFDPNAISNGGHLGLFGMRERIETVDGELVIESAPGKGTTVMAQVKILPN